MLSPAQIVAVAQNAGFTGADLATAAAIALAESSGNPAAYNGEEGANTPPGQGSYGLWQIYLAMHPEFAGENLYDPQTNANAAFAVYSAAGGFTPWATYNSGKYRQFLPAVLTAPPTPPPLTLDAATGLPVTDTAPAYQAAAFLPSPGRTAGIGTYILWGVLGFLALWLFEESA